MDDCVSTWCVCKIKALANDPSLADSHFSPVWPMLKVRSYSSSPSTSGTAERPACCGPLAEASPSYLQPSSPGTIQSWIADRRTFQRRRSDRQSVNNLLCGAKLVYTSIACHCWVVTSSFPWYKSASNSQLIRSFMTFTWLPPTTVSLIISPPPEFNANLKACRETRHRAYNVHAAPSKNLIIGW